MMKKNNRKQKAKIIRGIIEGKINIDVLQPPQVYVFIEKSTNPGIYEKDGKQYTENEYMEFCEKLKQRQNNSIAWSVGEENPQQDIIITIRSYESKPIDETTTDEGLTLNL